MYLLNAQQQDGSCGVEGRGNSPGKREKMAIKNEKGKKEKHTNKKKERHEPVTAKMTTSTADPFAWRGYPVVSIA